VKDHSVFLSLIIVALAGCGKSVPENALWEEPLRKRLAYWGEAVDLRKENGQELSVDGARSYKVYVNGATKLADGYWLQQFRSGGMVDPGLAGRVRGISKVKSPNLFTESTRLSPGTLFAVKAEGLLESTEKGWVLKSLNFVQFTWCADSPSVEACYTSAKWHPALPPEFAADR
jgi:hypothetical protein